MQYSGRCSSKIKKLPSGITIAWILAVLAHVDHDKIHHQGLFLVFRMLQETKPLAESSSLQGQRILPAWALKPSLELLIVQYFRQYILCFYKLFPDGTAPDFKTTISVSLNAPLQQNSRTDKNVFPSCLTTHP